MPERDPKCQVPAFQTAVLWPGTAPCSGQMRRGLSPYLLPQQQVFLLISPALRTGKKKGIGAASSCSLVRGEKHLCLGFLSCAISFTNIISCNTPDSLKKCYYIYFHECSHLSPIRIQRPLCHPGLHQEADLHLHFVSSGSETLPINLLCQGLPGIVLCPNPALQPEQILCLPRNSTQAPVLGLSLLTA